MKQYKIYTAGKMTGLTYEEQIGWREELGRAIRMKSDQSVVVINPPKYYNPLDQNASRVEMEAKEWDLSQIADSDIVVFNLQDIETSIGTIYELGFVNALNAYTDKHIYVIGIGGERPLHPWIKSGMFRWEPDFWSAADYIVSHLII